MWLCSAQLVHLINLSRYWNSESFWYFWLTSKYLLYDVTKVCLYNHDLSCRYFFSHKYDMKFILVCSWINFRFYTFAWCKSNTTEREKFAQNNVSFTLEILEDFPPVFSAVIPWPTPPTLSHCKHRKWHEVPGAFQTLVSLIGPHSCCHRQLYLANKTNSMHLH